MNKRFARMIVVFFTFSYIMYFSLQRIKKKKKREERGGAKHGLEYLIREAI